MKPFIRYFALFTLPVLLVVGVSAMGFSQTLMQRDFRDGIDSHQLKGMAHQPHGDRQKECVGHESMRSRALVPHSQVWVIDTALVYGATDTTRHLYTFNGQAKMTVDLEERWTNNQWMNDERGTCMYDPNGRLLARLHEYWTNNQWVNSFHYTYTYDANGNRLTELRQGWLNNQWENSSRYAYTYDANGNRLTELDETWTGIRWVNSWRETYTYDGNGNRLTALYQRWEYNEWVNYGRRTYTYDANGRVLTTLYEQWWDPYWVNYNRVTYTYDTNGNMLTWLYEQWAVNQWLNYWRGTCTYDANERMLTELDEQWTNNQWENYCRYTYTYDANGSRLTGIYQIWVDSGWVPRYTDFNVADSAGNSYSWSSVCKLTLAYVLITTEVAYEASKIPTAYELSQNYPNPFNPSTTIKYDLPRTSQVSLSVFDILGREVATLLNEEKPAGAYTVQWDAGGVASGVYFYRLRAGDFVQTKRMMVVR